MMVANVVDVLVLVRVLKPALVLINYCSLTSFAPGRCETLDSFRWLLRVLLSAFNLRSLLCVAPRSEVRVRYRWMTVGRINYYGYGDCTSTLMSTMVLLVALHCTRHHEVV